MLSKEQTFTKAEFPVYSSESTNGGVIGYTDNPDFICDYQHPIYITFGDHTRTFNVVQKSFSVLDNVKVLLPCTDNVNCLLFFIAAWQKQIPNLGYARHWKVAKDCIIQLPEKSKGVIDFEFIENFVRELERARLRELERARLRELEAYLTATGLNNYELTATDRATLANFKNIKWGHYSLGKLFDIQNTLSFNTDRLTNGEEYDYITRTSFNQGILQATGFVNQENINPAGTWSLGLLQMDFFYRNRPWYAGQFVRKIVPKIKISERSKLFFQTILNMQKSVLLQVLVRNVDETFRKTEVQLPQTEEGEIDFEYIEQLVAAVQKIVIADVAKYTARNLEATQQVIESQESIEERKELKVTLIHPEYQPGFIPLYTLRAACGYFEDSQVPEEEGWIDASGLGFTPDPKRHFAVHAKGDSMLPKIKDGDICIFEWYNAGSRNGEIVLTQSSEYDDAYGGRYTIKRYHSEKTDTDEGWQHSKVELQPLNPDFDPIELDEFGDYKTIGIFKCVL